MRLPHDLPAPPRYGHRSIAELMSSAAAAVGVPDFTNALSLPSAARYVVVLVDGLGSRLLAQRSGYAPTLRSAQSLGELDAAFPTTTSVSLSSLGTGKAPGQHGMLGYDVVDPARQRVVNMLGNWDPEIDPKQWQSQPTVLERSTAHVDTVSVSRARFETSALTQASLRGGRFVAADGVFARTTSATANLKEGTGALMYFYWDELDKVGHSAGWESDAWTEALEELDSAMRRLLRSLPGNTRVILSADHGMVDIPQDQRIDYSQIPGLTEGVHLTAGEPRAVQLHVEPHVDTQELAHRWTQHFGDDIWVATRGELAQGGYFGAQPDPELLKRAGDLWILAKGPLALYDLRRQPARSLAMVGQHGSLTEQERAVPLLLW